MKFSWMILALVLVLGQAACNKPSIPIPDDKEDSGNKGPSIYVGTWEYTMIDMSNGTLSAQGQALGTFKGSGKDMIGTVVVTENPNRFVAELEYTAALTLSIFNQSLQQEVPVEKRIITGDWSEKNGEISLKADDGSDIEVISSTANKVVFKGEFTEKLAVGQQFNFDAVSDVQVTIEK